jgi:hypothetical protein
MSNEWFCVCSVLCPCHPPAGSIMFQLAVSTSLSYWRHLNGFEESKYRPIPASVCPSQEHISYFPRDRPKFVGTKDRQGHEFWRGLRIRSQPSEGQAQSFAAKITTTQIIIRDHGSHHPTSITQRHYHSSATAWPNPLKINDNKVDTSFYNSFHF